LGAAALNAGRCARDHDGWQGLNVAGRALGKSTFSPGRQAYRYRQKKQESSAHPSHPIAPTVVACPTRRGCYNVTAVVFRIVIDMAAQRRATGSMFAIQSNLPDFRAAMRHISFLFPAPKRYCENANAAFAVYDQ
jgi:hypothetical protein